MFVRSVKFPIDQNKEKGKHGNLVCGKINSFYLSAYAWLMIIVTAQILLELSFLSFFH